MCDIFTIFYIEIIEWIDPSIYNIVEFDHAIYYVDEDDGPAQPTLILSNPSSTDITVQVFNTDGTATGEYCSILINYNVITNMLQEEVLIMVLDHTLSHFLLDRHVLHSMFQ